MQTFIRAIPLFAVITLAGCVGTGTNTQMASQPVLAPAAPTQPMLTGPVQAPAVATTSSMLNTDIAAYVDPTVLPMMSAKERSDASSAQFYALQFSRPGAPRTWSGPGSKGSIVVGPYVRVNNLDCRDFTNTVTVAGKDYVRKGTACREGNGNWSVAAGAA
jgi:surface antigen